MHKLGLQTLSLTNLRFDASVGVLDRERVTPQRIQVDTELNLGTQPLLPLDDDIANVLDYRAVRSIIKEECTRAHINLLESLVGQLANRLIDLPSVLGARIRITKLEVFDDCAVAISVEAGQWC